MGLLEFHITHNSSTACADQLLYNLSLIKRLACAKQNATVKTTSHASSLLAK